MDVWAFIMQLDGTTLKTLGQSKEFEIRIRDSNNLLVIPHSTWKPRPISRLVIEDAFLSLTTKGELSLMKTKRDHSDFNPKYIKAILSRVPGVSVRKRPVVLEYRSDIL